MWGLPRFMLGFTARTKTGPFEEAGIRKWAEGRSGQVQVGLRGTRRGGSGNSMDVFSSNNELEERERRL